MAATTAGASLPQPTIEWGSLARTQQSLYACGVTLIVIGSVAIVSSFAYVMAFLAIAAGAVLVDSFLSLERVQSKLGGTVGCGGRRMQAGSQCCCAVAHSWGLLISTVVFAVLSFFYSISISAAGFANYRAFRCADHPTAAALDPNYCETELRNAQYVGVAGIFGCLCAFAVIVSTSVALSRLLKLSRAVAGTPFAYRVGDVGCASSHASGCGCCMYVPNPGYVTADGVPVNNAPPPPPQAPLVIYPSPGVYAPYPYSVPVAHAVAVSGGGGYAVMQAPGVPSGQTRVATMNGGGTTVSYVIEPPPQFAPQYVPHQQQQQQFSMQPQHHAAPYVSAGPQPQPPAFPPSYGGGGITYAQPRTGGSKMDPDLA